MLMVVIVRVSK